MWGFVINSLLNMKKLIIIVLLAFIIPSVSSASFDVSLKYGSRGVAVEELQDFLQDQNLYTGKIDGKYGLGTLRAVKTFQTTNQLSADGYFGKASRAKANLILSSILEASDSAERADEGTITPPIQDNETKNLIKKVDELQAKIDAQTKIQEQIATNTKPSNLALPVPPPILKGRLMVDPGGNAITIALGSYTQGIEGIGLQITESPSSLKEIKYNPECHPATKDRRASCYVQSHFILPEGTQSNAPDLPDNGERYHFKVIASGQTFNFDVAKGERSQSFDLK